MSFYINSNQVLTSFKRLASRDAEGKLALERTSALMYFLAFDAASKKAEQSCLDLNPERTTGKNNRKSMEFEFTRLVLIGKDREKTLQISELGKFSSQKTPPEKRISSNFFTVPLKKASEQAEPFYYPGRPAHLLQMGKAATGIKWGMRFHDDWRENLPKFLVQITGSTAFTDLAFVAVRDEALPPSATKNYLEALEFLLKERHSSELAGFWIDRLKKEKVWAQISEPFSDTYEPLAKKIPVGSSAKVDEESTRRHIEYLEKLLTEKGIKFKPLTK